VRVADYAGDVLVVNLWATWCPPCKTEMPSLARLQAAYPEQRVRVIAVSIDGERKLNEARAFIAANAPLTFHHSGEGGAGVGARRGELSNHGDLRPAGLRARAHRKAAGVGLRPGPRAAGPAGRGPRLIR
jgi:hypothetical protein